MYIIASPCELIRPEQNMFNFTKLTNYQNLRPPAISTYL